MDLAQITNQLQILWRKVPQKGLTRALMVMLAIYMAYWCANMTWQLVPAPKTSTATPRIAQNSPQESAKTVDVRAIAKLNLFGEYNKKVVKPKPVQTVESAPETRLKLTLTGVVASSNEAIAAAIIESRGTQETYGIDDKITGTQAILKQVHADRVIIQSSGRIETLMLDGFKYTKELNANVAANSSKKSLPVNRGNMKPATKAKNDEARARIKQRVSQARSEILANPAKLTDYMRVSPYRRQGKVVGYRLMPSKNPEFFKEVGLIAGDIAVQINGRDLTDMREAQQALIELRKAQQVELLVERDGVLHDISLGLEN